MFTRYRVCLVFTRLLTSRGYIRQKKKTPEITPVRSFREPCFHICMIFRSCMGSTEGKRYNVRHKLCEPFIVDALRTGNPASALQLSSQNGTGTGNLQGWKLALTRNVIRLARRQRNSM